MTNTSCDPQYFGALARHRRVTHEADLHQNPEAFVTLGARLEHVRHQHNLLLHAMAGVIGVAMTTIRRWENDESVPSWFYLQTYSRALDIPLDVLLDGVAPTIKDVNAPLKYCCLPARYWKGINGGAA